jgi:beta-glucosidase
MRRVSFELDPSQLALYDRDMRLVVEPGEFAVRVGASSEDIRSQARFRIEGAPRQVSPREILPTTVRLDGSARQSCP